ncbi:PKD domain-containing protein [Flavobacterium sp. HJSW_4]|uniref:PKD domain-containing protein n=1 Tax=Flavobacterium sp. HJSW_4 TaxID=3344660 RepID=UPI0035F37338
MKKITTILMFAMMFFVSVSCSKNDAEDVLDCIAESAYISIHNSTDTTNPKLMNYSITYDGTGTLSSVKWTFGDGTTGTGATVTHTYTAAGTYEAVAEITVKKGGSECGSTRKRTVTVN